MDLKSIFQKKPSWASGKQMPEGDASMMDIEIRKPESAAAPSPSAPSADGNPETEQTDAQGTATESAKTEDIEDIIDNAVRQWASDIHVEPLEFGMRVRLRIDGHFNEYREYPAERKAVMIARIKILAGLKIDEQRLPQDGKMSLMSEGKDIDLRVSVIPTIYGEKIVIRILKKDTWLIDLRNIGILPMNMIKIKEHLQDSFGCVLIVGPTGSGKSTTLYSMISTFDPEEKNISTLEDPVEYRMKWVNHTQISPQIGFNFADGLRSLLRQDPDIIMVWEIRDAETAHLAIEASITGHLVFSTIHSNSTVNTIQRLINLWIDPLLIVSSLKMVVSQRLARKLCPHCKVWYAPDEKIKSKILGRIGKYISNKEDITFYRANENGCPKCNHKWHKWRTGFFEILEMTEWLEKLVLTKASKTQLEIQAIGDGMITIKDDALIKIVLGEVSLEEVVQVLGT